MLSDAPFQVDILPSAIMDVVKMRMFYDGIECGLGTVFRDHILSEVDRLEQDAGVDEMRYGYFFRPGKRFHQGIYYKMDGKNVTVWRILDMRFNPKRIAAALREML